MAIALKCQHPKWWRIGTLPEARYPLPLKEIPSEYRDEIIAGTLTIPGGSNFRPFIHVIPPRVIMHCPKCDTRKLVVENKSPRKKAA